MNLEDQIYNDETAARKHLEALQWPEWPDLPALWRHRTSQLIKGNHPSRRLQVPSLQALASR